MISELFTNIMVIMEMIGTIAFAISGALVAIGCSLDIFGVVFIGCITATGGGVLRDLLLGITPPAIFSHVYIFFVAALTSVAVFIFAAIHRQRFYPLRNKIEHINNIFDAIGLAAFSVTGTEIACNQGFTDNIFLVISMGMITGIGGGIIRDILVDETPYVLKKDIYALPSFLGSLFYYSLQQYLNQPFLSTMLAVIIVVSIRLMASKYHWKLPQIKLEENKNIQQ